MIDLKKKKSSGIVQTQKIIEIWKSLISFSLIVCIKQKKGNFNQKFHY